MHAIKISSFNGYLELSGLNEFPSWIFYGIYKIMPRCSIAWRSILARFMGKKSIWYMDLPIKTIITAKSIILS